MKNIVLVIALICAISSYGAFGLDNVVTSRYTTVNADLAMDNVTTNALDITAQGVLIATNALDILNSTPGAYSAVSNAAMSAVQPVNAGGVSVYVTNGIITLNSPVGGTQIRGGLSVEDGAFWAKEGLGLDNSQLFGPLDPTGGTHVGDWDFNNTLYLLDGSSTNSALADATYLQLSGTNAVIAESVSQASAQAASTPPLPFNDSASLAQLDKLNSVGNPYTVLVIGDSMAVTTGNPKSAPNLIVQQLINRFGAYGYGFSALQTTAIGNAAAVTSTTDGNDNYDDWITGGVSTLWNGGSLEFGDKDGVAIPLLSADFDIYYIADSRGGEIEIGHENSSGTYTTDVTINTYTNIAKSIQKVTVNLSADRYVVRVTANDASTNRIVGVVMYDEDMSGINYINMARGGLAQTNTITMGIADFTNTVVALAPDLVIWRAADRINMDFGTDGADAYFDYWRTNLAESVTDWVGTNNYARPQWVTFGHHDRDGSDTNAATTRDWLEVYTDTNGWLYVDEDAVFGGFDRMVDLHLTLNNAESGHDMIHLNDSASMWLANYASKSMGLDQIQDSEFKMAFTPRESGKGGNNIATYSWNPLFSQDIQIGIAPQKGQKITLSLSEPDNKPYRRIIFYDGDDATYPAAMQIWGGGSTAKQQMNIDTSGYTTFGDWSAPDQIGRVQSYSTWNLKGLYYGWHTAATTVDLLNFDTGAGQVDTFGVSAHGALRFNDGVADSICGTATLVAGTNQVSTTAIAATSKVILSRQSTAGTAGFVDIQTISAGTSFVIESTSATDTSDIFWTIVEPY